MQKQQVAGFFALLLATAAVIGGARLLPSGQSDTEEETAYQELLENTPMAELAREHISPDGRFEVQVVGKSDIYVSGVVVPEKLQVVDRENGEIMWEDQGWVTQSALWSPNSHYLALAYGARTWQAIRVIETDTWTAWDFTLPDGSSIPEYTFLPENWGAWEDTLLDESSLRVQIGYGEEATICRCAFRMEGGTLTGDSFEEAAETLPEKLSCMG